jgi:plasmid stabilization system protein ParE
MLPIIWKNSSRSEIVAHPNYIVVYQVKADTIDVLRVLHSRQQYP